MKASVNEETGINEKKEGRGKEEPCYVVAWKRMPRPITSSAGLKFIGHRFGAGPR